MNVIAEVLAFLGNYSVLIFGAVLLVAVLVRVAISLVRRRPRGVKDAIAPIFSSGAVESELYGYKPALEEPLLDPSDPSTIGEAPRPNATR